MIPRGKQSLLGNDCILAIKAQIVGTERKGSVIGQLVLIVRGSTPPSTAQFLGPRTRYWWLIHMMYPIL